MPAPLQIGITGGIGSGKSIVCRIFQCLGIAVYDADSRAKAVMTTDGIVIDEIKKEFGGLSYYENGALNREYLARTVFHDPEKLSKLNQLVHPRVHDDYKRWLEKHQHDRYVIREAALLLETGADKQLNRLVVVYAPEALRTERTLRRDPHRTFEQVKAIMAQQWPDEEKLKRANAVIYNDDTRLVIPQVLELHRQLLDGN
ncbi:MAG: dephospho-CoA kinase [Cyclobacteriaceae bacterium]|jgi:dephospho-CoA kinase|nr:dephospho-CoA kinase [Cyclobacteriaceae bacterium]